MRGSGVRSSPHPGEPRFRSRRPRILTSSRIGIDYAGDAKNWRLRFFDGDSEAVSR